MFSLFSGVYNWLFSRPEVCLLLVGLQGSGKTTFFEQVKQRYATSGSKAVPGITAVEKQQQSRASVDNADKRQHDRGQHEQPTHGKRRDTVPWRIVEQHDTLLHGRQQEESHQNHAGPSLPLRQRQTADAVGALADLRAASTRQSLCSLPRVSSTTGLNYCRFRYQDVDVVLWDLAGLASFHAMWEDYFRNAHCVLYFVDSTSSAESMRESRTALDSLLSAAATVPREDTSGKKHNVCPPPVLVVAAKQDLTRAPLESAGELQAFSSGKANSAACSARQQQTQQPFPKHERPLGGSADHGSLSDVVLPHSACSWDSVEELFRRAVRSAKAYHELLSLPVPEVGPASLEKHPAPIRLQKTCYKPGGPCCHADREIRTSLPGIAAASKGQALEEKSGLQLVHAGSKYGKTVKLPHYGSHRRHTCRSASSAVWQSDPAEGNAQVFLNSVEVPCCHYGTTLPASEASSIAGASFVFAPLSGGSYTDATRWKTGRLTKAAITVTQGGGALHSRAYDASGGNAPFRVRAVRGEYHTCGEGGECTASKTNVSRVSSGLYELDDSV